MALPLAGAALGAGLQLGGAVLGGIGAKKDQSNAEDSFYAMQSQQQAFLDPKYEALKTLEGLSQKLRSGNPITDEERAWFDSRRQSMWDNITQARNEAVKNIMSTGAASGFLRGGRTQAQVRQANVELGRALAGVAVDQNRMEVDLQQERQRRADAMLNSIMGTQVPQFQQAPVGISDMTRLGAGLSGLGSGMMGAFGPAAIQGFMGGSPQGGQGTMTNPMATGSGLPGNASQGAYAGYQPSYANPYYGYSPNFTSNPVQGYAAPPMSYGQQPARMSY